MRPRAPGQREPGQEQPASETGAEMNHSREVASLKIDRRQFMEDGFIILRDVVPPATLGPLRDAVERMVEGRRGRTSQKPLPNQPPSGTWDDLAPALAHFQHRLRLRSRH